MMEGEGDTTAQMTYNQVEILVTQVVLPAVTLGNLTLVERMPDGLVGHLGESGDAGDIIQFIHHTRINGESAAA